MPQKLGNHNQENSSINPLGRHTNFYDFFLSNERDFEHMPVRTRVALESLTALNCEGGCFGDSHTGVTNEPNSKSPIKGKELKEAGTSPTSPKPLITSSKVIHIDITPADEHERSEEEQLSASDLQHTRKIKWIESKIAIGNTISLEVADHNSDKNIQTQESDTLAPLNGIFAPRESKAEPSLSELSFESVEKISNHSNALESVVEKRAASKISHPSARHRCAVDFPPDSIQVLEPCSKKKETAESFAQTETWDLKKERKSKLKKNLEELFFSCARYCI